MFYIVLLAGVVLLLWVVIRLQSRCSQLEQQYHEALESRENQRRVAEDALRDRRERTDAVETIHLYAALTREQLPEGELRQYQEEILTQCRSVLGLASDTMEE